MSYRSTGATVLAATFATVMTLSWALAQAGSVGGAIGKTGKSSSGSDEGEERASGQSQHGRTPNHREPGGCTKVIGVWKGAMGGDIIYKAGGTAVCTSPANEGTWSCSGGRLTVSWTKLVAVDQCSLSADGNEQACTNSLGFSFKRTRKSGN